MHPLKKVVGTKINVFLFLFLGLGLIITVYSAVRQQNLRSRAATEATCENYTAEDIAAPPSQGVNVADDTKKVLTEYKSLTGFSLSNDSSLTNLKTTASRRKKELLRLMRRNPEEAVPAMLSLQEQTQLNAVTQNCFEQTTTLEGTVDYIIVDYENGQNSDVYTLIDKDNQRIAFYPAGNKKINLTQGMKIRATGYKIDKNLLVDTNSSGNIQQLSEGIAADIPSSQGVQKTVGLLVNFQNITQPAVTVNTINSTIFTDVNNYYKDTSYNKTSLSGDTYGWFNLPINMICNIPNGDHVTVLNSAINVAKATVDFSKYDRIVLLAPFGSCGWNGVGSIGKTVTLNGKTISVAWIKIGSNPTSTYLTRVISHEYGHNLGVGHATMQKCKCTLPEYGDPYSVMGKNQFGGGDQVVEWNALHRDVIGWFSGTNVKTVTGNGTFTLEPIESATSGLKAIKIPRGSNNYIYAEYRQAIGVDKNISGITGTDAYNGALLHIIYIDPTSKGVKSDLIDTTPSTSVPASAIMVGSSYFDSTAGVTIAATNKTSSGLTLQVTFGNTPPTGTSPTSGCTNQQCPPTATPTGPQNSGATPTRTPTPTQGGPTPTTPSGNPTATRVPTSPPGVNTPTPTPIQSEPTPPAAGDITITSLIGLHGIGTGGDNQNPSASGTSNPKNPNRTLFIGIFDANGDFVTDLEGNMQFDQASGKFRGTISLPAESSGNYTVEVYSDRYLTKRFPGFFNLSRSLTLPTISLTTGDINNDNQLDILDYNDLIQCYSGIVAAADCSNQDQKEASDLNDNGTVDKADYNLFLRELLASRGD